MLRLGPTEVIKVWVIEHAGGTFALYALLCRHLKLSLILNQQAADEELSAYKFEQPSTESPRGVWLRRLLDRHKALRNGLLIVVLLGTCMVIGDGALTPALSGSKSTGSFHFLSTLIITLLCIRGTYKPSLLPQFQASQISSNLSRHVIIAVFLTSVNRLPFGVGSLL